MMHFLKRSQQTRACLLFTHRGLQQHQAFSTGSNSQPDPSGTPSDQLPNVPPPTPNPKKAPVGNPKMGLKLPKLE